MTIKLFAGVCIITASFLAFASAVGRTSAGSVFATAAHEVGRYFQDEKLDTNNVGNSGRILRRGFARSSFISQIFHGRKPPPEKE